MLRSTGAVLLFLILAGAFASGDVTGLVTIKGATNSHDESFYAQSAGCGESPVRRTENWKIGTQGELADVVIWIDAAKLSTPAPPPLPPSQITQLGCQYRPHVIVAYAGVPVLFINADPTLHNILARVYNGPDQPAGDDVFNCGQSHQGQQDTRTFDDAGLYTLQCNVHSWMTAWVRVLPVGAIGSITGEDGKFTLPGSAHLADGTYVVSAWHPRFAAISTQSVVVKNGAGVANFTFDGTKSL